MLDMKYLVHEQRLQQQVDSHYDFCIAHDVVELPVNNHKNWYHPRGRQITSHVDIFYTIYTAVELINTFISVDYFRG